MKTTYVFLPMDLLTTLVPPRKNPRYSTLLRIQKKVCCKNSQMPYCHYTNKYDIPVCTPVITSLQEDCRSRA